MDFRAVMENRAEARDAPHIRTSTEEQDVADVSPEQVVIRQPDSPPLSPAPLTDDRPPSHASSGTSLGPIRRPSLSSFFSKYVRKAGSMSGKTILGVSFEQRGEAKDKLWVVTITKAGRWLLYIHLILVIVGTFELVTNIYSWKSNSDSDAMMQTILTKMSKSGSRFEDFTNDFTKWMNASSARSAEEEARLTEEQERWDVLLKVFEDCGASSNQHNETRKCDDLRRFFEDNPLPHPDKSHIAKRNIAKLDRIIRRVHLEGPRPVSPEPAQASYLPLDIGRQIGFFSIPIFILLLLMFSYYFWPAFRARVQNTYHQKAKTSRADDYADEKVAEDVDDSGSIAIAATGGNYLGKKNNLTFRKLQRFDQHAAAARGSVEDLRDNERNVHVNQIDENNEYGSVLAAAARSGSLETVDYVLTRKPDVWLLGGRYYNVLQAAAHSGNRSIVSRLLTAGARDNFKGGFYGSAANAAAEKGDVEMLKDLLAHYRDEIHSNINHAGGTYGNALIAAGARGNNEAIKILLDHGSRINIANQDGTTALHQAAGNGHIETTALLLARNAEVNSLSTVYGTPLHAACHGLHADVAKKLLTTNVDVSIKDHHQRTMLHVLAQSKEGLEEVFLETLRLRPDMIDEVDTDGVTALHLASISGNVPIVKALLNAGANCSIGDKFQAQPLFRAAGCGHAEIVSLLLKDGKADPNAVDCFGRTALHGPARTDDVRVQDLLITAGADVNAIGTDRKTPLHEACNMGRIKNVELLLAQPDIKVNELDNDQFPPLYKALCSSDGNKDNYDSCINRNIIELFLVRADLDVDVSSGIIVQEAAAKGYLPEVETMLQKSQSSLQMRGGKYGGVLQAASISGNLQLINLLLRPGYHANVNIQGGEFGCPLAAAAAFGHVNVVRRLLEAGADPSVSGIGRYESPLQSTCRQIEVVQWRRERYKWASIQDQIQNLLREHGEIDTRQAKERYLDWRWLLTSTGWDWAPPGEM